MANDLLLQTMTLTNDRPVLSSERVPHKNNRMKIDLREIGWIGLIWLRIGTSGGLL
jgi:hypothetical protein